MPTATRGHKSKKYREDKPQTTADIGDLLWRPQSSTRPVMVPLSDGPSCSSSETSLTDLRELETLTRSKQAYKPSDQKTGVPVTESTLKALLDELRHNIATDISAFREEISRVSSRLHDMEVTTAGHETRLTTLKRELSALKCEQAKTQHHMAAIEDRRRCKNVKVRGLPDTVAIAEIPHLIQRLLTQLFSTKPAKLMTLDGCYRLPVPPAVPKRSRQTLLEDTEIPSTLQKIRLAATSEGSPTPAPATQPNCLGRLKSAPFVPAMLQGNPATTDVS
ncbi:Hypothetical predicted protein [Pelobates cultripes]|uniref:Uncharacterized protein n=1 Tax=Pelobates cultripes TaxID=61616 RepID=A0AAD1SZM6_PELCU|nr:Hypothetical predicted protein [Pelobates cultripes]